MLTKFHQNQTKIKIKIIAHSREKQKNYNFSKGQWTIIDAEAEIIGLLCGLSNYFNQFKPNLKSEIKAKSVLE